MRQWIVAALFFLTTAMPVFSQQKAAPAAKPHPAGAAAEPTAIIDTTMGTLRCKLFEKETPKTVANFIGLAEGTKDWKSPVTHQLKHGAPLYTGTIFHRVIPDFMIQGGDPLGNGMGDPGYSFEDEFVSSLKFDRPGRLAMANSGPNTNGSQFFITDVPTPHLNGKHTIFGQCDNASVALVKKIAHVPSDPRDNKPFTAVRINKITIARGGAAAKHGPTKPKMPVQ